MLVGMSAEKGNAMADLIDRNELLPNKVFYVNAENPMTSIDELLNRIANAKSVDAVALPCKMGDEVWGIRRNGNFYQKVMKGKVFQMFFGDDMRLCISVKNVCRGEWGKSVFATQEEAEAALADA